MKKIIIACCVIVALLLVYAMINGSNEKARGLQLQQEKTQQTKLQKEIVQQKKAKQEFAQKIRKSEEALVALSIVDNGGVWTQDQIKKLCHIRWMGKPKRFEMCLGNNKAKLGTPKDAKLLEELGKADKLAAEVINRGSTDKQPAPAPKAVAPAQPAKKPAPAGAAAPIGVIAPKPSLAPQPTQPTP